ncbi:MULTISPECIES: hypothetical protein [Lacticaseibacillus]|jgi:Zn-dependent oligopeptidase|uniref:Uncharacterized protein n=2 Tax=Lacticaseibacillus TaxID=2759736 RepID=A0ABY8DZB4_9LACO|nr:MULTISPECIES: hypothetical protein [Lacticaseibacillus]MDG3062357.1 hypothetical protein [Lacticaseibacillus sp. BCRC 81376]WFB40326.1 hypothetical protein LHUE1_001110 [Lacticaseibacillus huelsenbergensis]WFB42078.1 hypothetical protein LHUE2_000034 [Lacticaseibacillus huelsenbergensis]
MAARTFRGLDMTFTFDGLVKESAEHAGLKRNQFDRQDIEDYVVYNISNIQSSLENLQAFHTLSSLSVLFEEFGVPLRISVMMKDNKTKVDYVTIRLSKAEYDEASQKVKSMVERALKRKADGEK